MKKIDRYDPCVCGSGKKYKHCCGKNIISLERKVDDELKEVQIDIINFAIEYYGEEMHDHLGDWTFEIYTSEEAYEMFFFFASPWFITTVEVKGKTIMEHYIDRKLSKWKHQRTKDIIKSWKKAKPIVAIVKDKQNDTKFILEDIFTKKNYEVKTFDVDHPIEIGDIVLGVILPYQNAHVFFTSFINLPAYKAMEIEETIIELYEESREKNGRDYLISHYLDVLYQFIFNTDLDLYDLEWRSPKHLEVAEEFVYFMEINQDRSIIELGIFLWYEYCLRKNPKILKPSIYTAALVYLIDQLNPFGELLTQNELAEMFAVPTSSLASRYRDMKKVLKNEIDELEKKLDSIDYEKLFQDMYLEDEEAMFPFDQKEKILSPTQIEKEAELLKLLNNLDKQSSNLDENNNHYFDNTFENQNKAKKMAQELLFEAYEAEGNEQISLVKTALKIYPNLPQAYNMLAEATNDQKEKEQMLLKAMEVGEKELGEKFFLENKGDFWLITSTRPYMEAKYNYALFLQQTGRLKEAMTQFEEMLELNPNDNQGVRYDLFTIYVKLNLLDKAKKLMNEYDEGETTHELYNRSLLEFLQHGPSKKAKKLLQKAMKINPFVPEYLLNHKELPPYLPWSFQFGNEDEAILYVDQTLDLWRSNKKLLEWLKKVIKEN